GCSCSLGLAHPSKPCTMPPITFQDLPLNIYMGIFGTGIFIFVLSLIFCCYFIGKLRHQAQSERFGYKEEFSVGIGIPAIPTPKCPEFPAGITIPAIPARRCLLKWLEVRCVCPMCNEPMAGPGQPRAGIGTLLDELL
ncbi:RN122 protein, partial [Prunella himalayana]|nr:RN122 protein [Prunella himalayana]